MWRVLRHSTARRHPQRWQMVRLLFHPQALRCLRVHDAGQPPHRKPLKSVVLRAQALHRCGPAAVMPFRQPSSASCSRELPPTPLRTVTPRPPSQRERSSARLRRRRARLREPHSWRSLRLSSGSRCMCTSRHRLRPLRHRQATTGVRRSATSGGARSRRWCRA